MFNSQGPRKLFLAVAAAAFLTVAGCSNQGSDQATNQAPAPQVPPKKAPAAKPVAKTAAAQPAKAAPAKPAARKPDAGKAVAAKSPATKPAAKPVAASSKVMPPATLVTIPKGTAISATVGQALASNKNHSGDTFAAILSSSIKVDGKTIIPKGTHVTGRVVTAKKGSELTVALASVDLNGKSYKLVTEPLNRPAKTSAKSDAGDTDAAKASPKKDITVAAQTRLKFKLAKDVKLPVAVKS